MCCLEQSARCEKEMGFEQGRLKCWERDDGVVWKVGRKILLTYSDLFSPVICTGTNGPWHPQSLYVWPWLTVFWLTSTNNSTHFLQLPKAPVSDWRMLKLVSGPKLLGLPAESFDVCLFSMVLHHWTQELQHESLQKVWISDLHRSTDFERFLFFFGMAVLSQWSWYDWPKTKVINYDQLPSLTKNQKSLTQKQLETCRSRRRTCFFWSCSGIETLSCLRIF